MRKYIRQFIPFAMVALIVVLCSTVVYAATWRYAFPTVVIDTSGTDRVYYPVLLGYGGQTLIDAGYIDANGLDTNMQISTTDIKYMMSTTNVATVIPNLPSGGTSTASLYTDYAPVQTNFPIIVGDGGYVTIADDADLELADDFEIEWKGYVNTDAGVDKNLLFKEVAFRTYIQAEDAIRAAMIDPPAYPVIAATNGGNDVINQLNHTVNLPAGINAGDLLVVYFVSDGVPLSTWPAGWFFIVGGANAPNVICEIYYRIADGTEGASIIVSTDANQMTAHTSHRITGYGGIPEDSATDEGADNSPDPPNLAPSWGSTTTLWIAASAYDVGTRTVNAYPANFINNNRNDRSNNAEGVGVGIATRNLTAAAENPGVFTLSAAEPHLAWTIAVQPAVVESTEATVTGITSGERIVTAEADAVNLTLSVTDYDSVHLGNSPQSTALLGDTVPDNANDWVLDETNVMPYMEYYKHTTAVGGVSLKAHYEPDTMLVGTLLVDEAGGDEDGTIVWGTNTSVTIVYREMLSYEGAEVTSAEVDEYEMPTASLPTTWFARGENVANLPFYDSFLASSAQTGIPVVTMYFWWIIGLAFGVALFLMMFTRSALLGVIGLTVVLFIGSSMTIVPMWIPFVVLIIDILIMYLYRQVSY